MPVAQAGINRWTRGTPDWGPGRVVSVWASSRRPDSALAAAENGLYQSDDAGQHWRPLSAKSSVWGLAVDPRDDLHVYAYWPDAGGVQQSHDGGLTWAPSNAGLPHSSQTGLNTLTILPSDPDTLFFDALFDLYRSTDGGDSWSPVLAGQGILGLAAYPFVAGALYAWSGSSVYRSLDNGDHWEVASAGIPATSFSSVAVDSTGAVFATADGRLFRSSDRGFDWTEVAASSQRLGRVFASPHARGTIYVIAGGPGGTTPVSRSTDGGRHWVTLVIGAIPSIDSLWFTPRESEVFAAGATTYRSESDGDFWEKSATSPSSVAGRLLQASLTEPTVVYAAGGTNRVSRSEDAGEHWNRTDEGLDTPESLVSSIVTRAEPGSILAATADGLYETVTAGREWSRLSDTANLNQILVSRTDESQLAAIEFACFGYSCDERPYMSQDAGRTWTEIDLPAGLIGVSQIVDSPGAPDSLFALGENDNLLRGPISGPLVTITSVPFLRLLAADPSAPGTLFGVVDESRPVVYRSEDAGSSWASLPSNGLPAFVNLLLVGPTGILYAVNTESVYRSDDRGATWTGLPRDGMEDPSIRSLAVSSDGETVFAGTDNAVYQFTACTRCDRVSPARPAPRTVPRVPSAP